MAKPFSLPSLCNFVQPSTIKSRCSTRLHITMQVKAQSLDEGRSRNIVDSNLSVLREKMAVVKMRERLEKYCCKHQQNGWNYSPGYNYKLRRAREVSTFFELIRLVGVTLGFTCFTATFFLVLVSILVRLNQW
ncbi:uncharacterized protein LOC126634116 [Malus sylvestris]|uniref:uncharacterized protein LOC126634116 n=1 Tax=Malus sylvestris TaxID=3752 RepID=UPI0021ABBE61|nr:uncharacterized protein LOC126634116 [Malus sylvestris]XP_050160562.1 uncharacterized protein LOC126634116 [Malus sylvestris]